MTDSQPSDATETEEELSELEHEGGGEAETIQEEIPPPKPVSIFAVLDAPRILPEPIDLTLDHVKQIQNELGIITLCWPDVQNPKFENRVDFPETYVKNSNKEKLLLLYAENFRRQFEKLHPCRKPLFLACRNEVGMMKMVCTTLRPTTLPYPEIEYWKDCALFVGDHLKYEPLKAPTLLPTRLYSPHSVFLRRSGHSFEIATALCSLLLGQGYDAYVVSGYANQDVCLKIMTRINSPFRLTKEKEEIAVETEMVKKYVLKPAKDLHSKFLIAMEQREIDKIKAEEDRIAEEERQRMEELEKPPFDQLYGQRLHAWILLQPGTKDIDAITFVEPTTGTTYSSDCPFYCGIESVWNNINYWVNLQDCSKGLTHLDYDLTKLVNWEHLLLGEPLALRESEFPQDMDEDEVKYRKITDEKHLDMPAPWSLRISIPHNILKQRYPNGVKKIWYKRTFVEQFTPFIQDDGLEVRVCRYNDLECSPSQLYAMEEFYENRADNLFKINSDCLTGDTEELFVSGREDCLKRHFYKTGDVVSVEKERVLEFYHHARHDGLSKMHLHALYMTEFYENSEDGIYYRHIDFAPRGHPPPGILEGIRRIVVKIVEKFHRNENNPASEDVAIREFALVEGEVHIKYHYEEGKVTASTRDFIKPSLAEMGDGLRFKPDMTIGYQAEMGAKTPRQLQLFYLFEQQLEAEEQALKHIRDIEDQILEILKQRCIEKSFPKLDISLFDREHNEDHFRGMKEREQQEKEHREREVEDEVDYLTPYLARLGKLKDRLSRTEALQAREWCLYEFKQMLLDRAADIQQQFDSLSTRLQEKQQWHQMVQDTLTFDEENQYFEDLNEMQFLLRSLDIRLSRHRDLSPFRYELLENYLNTHPKLSSLFK